MLSVFQLGRFVCPFKIAGTREIGGFRILRRSAKCTPRPNLKAAREFSKRLCRWCIRLLQPSLKFDRPSCHARSRHTHRGVEHVPKDDAEHREVWSGIQNLQPALRPLTANNPTGRPATTLYPPAEMRRVTGRASSRRAVNSQSFSLKGLLFFLLTSRFNSDIDAFQQLEHQAALCQRNQA